MSVSNPKVDFYFNKESKWQEAIRQLRIIMLDCGLTEELKWGCPCYTTGKKSNIVLIHIFKEYCAVLFFKGALLNDKHHILIQQTENVQSARQVRFVNIKEVNNRQAILKNFIYEAIEVEKAALKVELKKSIFVVADEFQEQLDAMPTLKAAFNALTPGRQRAYLLHFAAPKQSQTRARRVKKYIKQILDGRGLND